MHYYAAADGDEDQTARTDSQCQAVWKSEEGVVVLQFCNRVRVGIRLLVRTDVKDVIMRHVTRRFPLSRVLARM